MDKVFYNGGSTWRPTAAQLRTQRHLHSQRMESGYINEVMYWSRSAHDSLPKPDFLDLQNYLQFFVRFIEFPAWFITQYDVQPYHLGLLRRMYFEESECNTGLCISLGYKRPYGNSDVTRDIEDEYQTVLQDPAYRFADQNDDEEWLEHWREDHYTFLEGIHNRTMEILDLALQELEWYVAYLVNECQGFGANWRLIPDVKRLRALKLERVIDDESSPL
jgi:hypothetical protein